VMDGMELLAMRIIVDELNVEGVRFGTDREVSGAIAGAPPPAESASSLELPSLEIPDVKEILANEDLESLKLIEELEAEIGSLSSQWKQRIEGLPDEETFARYQEKIEDLAKGDPLTAVSRIEELRKDVKRDVRAIEKAGKDLEGELAGLNEKLAAAKKAPLADLERIRERYALSPQGAANLTASLLGDPIGQIVEQAIGWSERLQEMVAGEEGAQTAEEGATPDFLVRVARVSVELARGQILGTVNDITANQPLFGQPTTLAFAADAVPGLEELRLDGVLDRVDPDQPADSLDLVVRGYDAAGLSLSEDPSYPISITSGKADGEATLELGAADSMKASASLRLGNARLAAPFPGDSPLSRALAGAVEGVGELALTASAVGTTTDYRLQIESNVDRIFSDAIGGLLAREGERLTRELRTAILGETSGPLQALGREQQGLLEIEDVLSSRAGAGETVLDLKAGGLGKQLKKLKLF